MDAYQVIADKNLRLAQARKKVPDEDLATQRRAATAVLSARDALSPLSFASGTRFRRSATL